MPKLLEIQWVQKTDRFEVHDRIETVGGLAPSGTPWRLSHREAITAVDQQTHTFYVANGGHPLQVVVATTRFGFRYLKTTADVAQPERLLLLACSR